jgi:hypothetical protein
MAGNEMSGRSETFGSRGRAWESATSMSAVANVPERRSRSVGA